MKKRIVCLGGGTGTSVVLSGLKKYPVELSAIVSMADSGGSNRVIRDEFGLLPTSDIRQCFVALAQDQNNLEHSLRELFAYRFPLGKGFKGMTFGNLFMAALTDIFGSQVAAIKKTGQILRIKGKVLPATLTNSNLVAIYENGKKVVGESKIDETKRGGKVKIKKVYLKPEPRAYPEAVEAILKADLVVIGPGDLYTSLVVNLTIPGIVKVLRKTKAKIAYVLNLMTKFGQTYGFNAKEHVSVMEKYLGKGCLDFVLVNSRTLPKPALKKYKKAEELPVVDNLEDSYFKVVRGDFLSLKETKKVPGDVLKRSLIRHDSDKLAKVLIKLCRPR
ncbi:MAG: putative gluconeoproteinis factor [Parcubacteria group bacterium Gr01-1014_30]|nr:MAG: putative gluconeoproteinis factor [Parcubacteria group bacterium Gr01-1014_30]